MKGVCQAYATEIMAITSGQPCFVAGWSMGGTIAFEVAHILERNGCRIEGLILLDTTYSKGQDRNETAISFEIFINLVVATPSSEISWLFSPSLVPLHRRLQDLHAAIGSENLANMLLHNTEKLEVEYSVIPSDQELLKTLYSAITLNSTLTSGFKPETLCTPIHSLWSSETIKRGHNRNVWMQLTKASDRSSTYVLPCPHQVFVAQKNSERIAPIINTILSKGDSKNLGKPISGISAPLMPE
jgi:thioesterase domain-containing protein